MLRLSAPPNLWISVTAPVCAMGFAKPALCAKCVEMAAQPEGEWQPFNPSLLMKPLFRNWYPDWLVHGEEDPLKA